VQAKRPKDPGPINSRDQADLKRQCNTMLSITPSAFVFCYMQGWMRCGSANLTIELASKITQQSRSYIVLVAEVAGGVIAEDLGDPRLTSSLVSELPVPNVLILEASGQLDD
jgi:hypothetical protein